MRLTHFDHSCLLVERDGARILFDPGDFSHGFEGITGLDAILITHQHPDHADPDRLPALVEGNPDAALYTDPQTAALLGDPWTAVFPGDEFRIGKVRATGAGGVHAVIHPDMPLIDNTAFFLGTADNPYEFLHPGDSLFVPAKAVPEQSVDVLAFPAAAPFLRIGDAIDYLRAMKPRVAVPIHQGMLNDHGRKLHYSRYTALGPSDTEFRVLPLESSTEVS